MSKTADLNFFHHPNANKAQLGAEANVTYAEGVRISEPDESAGSALAVAGAAQWLANFASVPASLGWRRRSG